MSGAKRTRTDYTEVEFKDLTEGLRTGKISQQTVAADESRLVRTFLRIYARAPEKTLDAVKGLNTWREYAEAVIFDGLFDHEEEMVAERVIVTEVEVPLSPS